jgi:transposase-like protein
MEFCQNNQCFNHTQPSKDWYVKIGYYKPKTTNQSTPRYKCKLCGKSFSTHTNKFTANQKNLKSIRCYSSYLLVVFL